jgi:trehalose/maltose hydrolase-like predicted phosphorylase
LTNEGLAVIRGSAEYWAGRAEANDDGSWSIRQVCGSDEDAGIVDDNATTNTGAAWTLRLAHGLVSEAEGSAPDTWLEIADGLRLPWDDERGIPLQMEGWQHGQRIKQADAVMMVHPWNRDFDAETMAKMVDYYRAHYPPQAIMMGAAIDGVVDARLGRSEGVGAALEALMPHFRGPFLIPSEHPQNERVPFVTGLGGLLQLLVFGAAGVRIDDKGFHSTPCLPPGIGTLTLKGIFYDGTARDLVVEA